MKKAFPKGNASLCGELTVMNSDKISELTLLCAQLPLFLVGHCYFELGRSPDSRVMVIYVAFPEIHRGISSDMLTNHYSFTVAGPCRNFTGLPY